MKLIRVDTFWQHSNPQKNSACCLGSPTVSSTRSCLPVIWDTFSDAIYVLLVPKQHWDFDPGFVLGFRLFELRIVVVAFPLESDEVRQGPKGR